MPRLLHPTQEAPGFASLTPVIAVISSETGDLEHALDDSRARQDDAYWLQIAHGPFAWQTFLNWWVARRWIMPRDVTKQ